jgi:FkbM family methyltransferase
MGTLGYRAKSLIQRIAHRFGYRIESIKGAVLPIDVFDLAISRVAASQDFFFIQVGANDGVTDDPIRKYVTKYHWRGVLVEPQPEPFARLVENYKSEPQLAFENAAVAAEDGTAILYTVKPTARAGAGPLLASFNRRVVSKRIRSCDIEESVISTVSVPTLLARHGVRDVDLLQVDAEGFDFEIIKLFDSAACLPKIIHYENLLLSSADRDTCIRFLAKRDYRTMSTGINTLALRQDAV